MRKLFTLSLLCFIFQHGNSQQLHFTSQYLQHNSMCNAAAAGIANQSQIGISYRNQWSSFQGNHRTYM